MDVGRKGQGREEGEAGKKKRRERRRKEEKSGRNRGTLTMDTTILSLFLVYLLSSLQAGSP